MPGKIELVPLSARPDLRPQLFDARFRAAWPEFMMHDPTADLYFNEPHFDAVQSTAFAAIDPTDPTTAIGRAFAVPFTVGIPGRETLPDTGWDGVIRWAHEDRTLGRTPNAISALEITLLPAHRGQGTSRLIVQAMAAQARTLGFETLYVPLRPTRKHLEPHTPMAEYARRTRPDGLPTDPWLRTHIRLGATIVKIAPLSMTITGTLADWRRWTGLPLDTPGPHTIPGALSPVHIALDQDQGVYLEPNIWLRHDLA